MTIYEGLTSVSHWLLMEPLAREQGTTSQSIKLSALMVAAMVYVIFRLTGPPIMNLKFFEQSRYRRAGGILALALPLTMPLERARPRRGAGWYATDARNKRHKKFERALLLVKRKRRGEAIAASSPPRTYVEEDLSLELPPDFSKSCLFIVPDNWDPLASFGQAAPAPNLNETCSPSDAPSIGFDTCPVEEELSECTVDLQMQRKMSSHKEMEVETRAPPSPPFLHPEHLNLIFEVRSLVEDQIFRAIRVSQCLNMLYEAYSRATPQRQCPTCAQPYVIPVNGGKAKEGREESDE